MSSRPVSPHEKAFAKRQAGNRFNVTPATAPKPRHDKSVGWKPTTERLMAASGRATLVPGQKRPSRAPLPSR